MGKQQNQNYGTTMTMHHSKIFVAVSCSVILSCLIQSSHAWTEHKIEAVTSNYNGFKLHNGHRRRSLRSSTKSSKDAKNEKKDSKSDKSGSGQYSYFYPDDGFLDEDIAGDFEDMFGYIVTADHFSMVQPTKSSKKSSKSSKGDNHYIPGMSYPWYDEGKGGKDAKKAKLPYYDPHLDVGQSKGSKKGGPPKLTRPPSSPTVGPPGGPPGK